MNAAFKCPHCGKLTVLDIDLDLLHKVRNREMHVQEAFPDLTPSQREVIITGICEECWNDMFPEEE